MATKFNIAKSAFARERLTVSTSAVPCTVATFRDVAGTAKRTASGAVVTVIANNIYYTLHGAAPTNDATVSGIGTPLTAGNSLVLENTDEVARFQMIRNGASDAIVEVVYFR